MCPEYVESIYVAKNPRIKVILIQYHLVKYIKISSSHFFNL